MNDSKWAAITLALVLLTGVGTWYMTNGSLTSSLHTQPRVGANVFITVQDSLGTHDIASGNLIMDLGASRVRDYLGFANASSNLTSIIALGNTSAINDTMYGLDTIITAGNGFYAMNGTIAEWSNTTSCAFNVTKTFTYATAVGTNINAVALHWGFNNTGNLFAAASITATQFQNNDNCTDITSYDVMVQ